MIFGRNNSKFDGALDMFIGFLAEDGVQIADVESFKKEVTGIDLGDDTMSLLFKKPLSADIKEDMKKTTLRRGA